MPTQSAVSTPGGSGKSGESEHGSPRPSSPFAALSLRRTRFSSVPLVEIKQNVEKRNYLPPLQWEYQRGTSINLDVTAIFRAGGNQVFPFPFKKFFPGET
ncbi:hypothetical protein HNY73_003289 [Argiope bruennichi]|uniref:Uncharacterized protein n=1 Tax=Argiope bruennichi TaxID=94029 RepID=A0A8T0FWD7_ARGBR|nr:hypothetical protein HNY73_003289 [Argiope bruennichi]